MGGILKDGKPWLGTCSEWVLSDGHAWDATEIAEFFNTPSHEVHTLSFYDDKISSWLKPGVYPTVVDLKGTLHSGQLIDGASSEFIKK